MHEDRRPSLDVDTQTHQTAEQDVQAASAALLEGEEKRTPSISSEQAAAPGTPSTSNMHAVAAPLLKGEELWSTATSSEQAAAPATPSTSKSPSVTPADLEATAHPCTHIHTHAHKPSCTAHDIQSGRVVHPGTSPPSSRAQSARRWGLRGRPRQSRGSDDSGRRCASTLLKSLAAQHRHLRPETADAEALEPCTLAEAKCSPEPHELATRPHPSRDCQGGTAPIAAGVHRHLTPLSLHTPSTHECSGVPHHTCKEARVAADTRLIHWEATKRALHTTPFGTYGTCFTHAKASSPLEGNPAAASSMARNRRAILGHAFPINGSTTPSSLNRLPTTGSGSVAAGHTHWETVERILSATSPTHTTRISHTWRSAAHRRAYPNATAASPWTSAPYWGARPPSSRAATPQRCTVARRHHGLAAPCLTPPASSVTTTRNHPHPLPHG